MGRSASRAASRSSANNVSPDALDDPARIVDHVFARVAVLRDRFVTTELLEIAGVEAGDKNGKLAAAIIDIILALDGVTCGFQHVRQRRAQYGVACAAIVDGTGGVGADVFDLPVLPDAAFDVAIVFARGEDDGNLILYPSIGQPQVDEARSRDLGFVDDVAGRKVIDDGLGDLARVDLVAAILARGSGGDHRDVGAIVTMVGLFGPFDADCGHVKRGQASHPSAPHAAQRPVMCESYPYASSASIYAGSRLYQFGPISTSTLSGTISL